MILVLSLLAQTLHIGLVIAAAPIVAGITDWLDATLAGRAGPPVLLPWRDLIRLSRKTPMLLESVSVVSRIAPAVSLGTTAAAAALVPSFSLGMALSPMGDVLVVVSLLSAARVSAALTELDSGSARPGLTQQGAAALAVLAEPAMMLAMVAMGLMGGSFNLDLIIGQQREGILLPAAASAVVLTAMLALLLAEASVHDRDANENLGATDLAMLHGAGWLRRVVWFDLIGGLFLPVGMAARETGPVTWLFGLASWALKLGALMLALAAIRAMIGRIPRPDLTDLVGIAALLALLAIIIVLVSAGMA